VFKGENCGSVSPFFLEKTVTHTDTYSSAPTTRLLSTPEGKILDRKVALDLPLNGRGVYAKFGCTGSYRAQMDKEQTYKLSSLYTYVDNHELPDRP